MGIKQRAKAIEAAPEEEREGLNFRLALYEEGKPYRQGMFRPAATEEAGSS